MAFKLNNTEEVKVFQEKLDASIMYPLGYLDLVKAHEKCLLLNNGGRIFAALLDLKINFVALGKEIYDMGSIWNKYFAKDKPYDGVDPMTDQDAFSHRISLFEKYTAIIPRYRSMFDKYMIIVILLVMPDEYNNFIGSKSRKRTFESLTKASDKIPNDFVDHMMKIMTEFDDKFRTPEVHNTGSVRKWIFSIDDAYTNNFVNILGYWNKVLPLLKILDNLFDSIQIDSES